MAAEVGDVLKAVYIAMDEAVGRILQDLGENAVGVVLFTHGIEQGYSGDFNGEAYGSISDLPGDPLTARCVNCICTQRPIAHEFAGI